MTEQAFFVSGFMRYAKTCDPLWTAPGKSVKLCRDGNRDGRAAGNPPHCQRSSRTFSYFSRCPSSSRRLSIPRLAMHKIHMLLDYFVAVSNEEDVNLVSITGPIVFIIKPCGLVNVRSMQFQMMGLQLFPDHNSSEANCCNHRS